MSLRHLTLAWLSLSLPLPALAREEVAAAPASAAEDDARELRRVLHLANGQTIRVVSRREADRWSYKSKAGWRELAPGQVVRAVAEPELVREWKAREARTPATDLAARVQLASWAATEGLALEGLGALDRVLAADPDHAPALAALARHDWLSVPTLAVPEAELAAAKEALLRFGSGLPGASREVAVLELGRLPRTPELRAQLGSKIVERRSFAALALRRLFPREAAKPLMVHALLDASEPVRRESAFALRAFGDPALIAPALRALEKGSPTVRIQAASTLGDMGYAAAVEPMIARLAALQSGSGERLPHSYIFQGRQLAYIQDFDVEVAQFQAVADPQVNVLVEGQVTEAAIRGVQVHEVTVEASAIRTSLGKLTGAQPGRTTQAWLAWWQENAARWRAGSSPEPRPTTGGGQG